MPNENERSVQSDVREAVDIAMKIRGEVSRIVNGVNPRDPHAVAAYEATCAAATQIYCTRSQAQQ